MVSVQVLLFGTAKIYREIKDIVFSLIIEWE
jgi:hypothetical protein